MATLYLDKDHRVGPPARMEPPTLRMTTQTQVPSLPDVQARYRAAKARLLAAQDEKAEAIAEFERARALLGLCREEIRQALDKKPFPAHGT